MRDVGRVLGVCQQVLLLALALTTGGGKILGKGGEGEGDLRPLPLPSWETLGSLPTWGGEIGLRPLPLPVKTISEPLITFGGEGGLRHLTIPVKSTNKHLLLLGGEMWRPLPLAGWVSTSMGLGWEKMEEAGGLG